MKKLFLPILALAVVLSSCSAQSNANIETTKDSTAYSIGVIIGAQLKQAGDKVNANVAADAVKDVFNAKESKVMDGYTYAQTCNIAQGAYYQIDSTFDVSVIVKGLMDAIDGTETIKAENTNQYIMDYVMTKTQGEEAAYMAEVAKIEGIQKTDNGIYYKIENQGEGTICDTADVNVHYTLYDYTDKVIDSSVERNEPLAVKLPSGVVPGFAQAIQLVGVGGKLTVWIPSELGYGEAGSRGGVGPNQALKFDIEVVEVK